MNDIVLSFIDINGQVNYGVVIPVFLGYMAFFWLVVSIWIFFDARKRFESKKVALLVALGNLLFLVPFFLIYLLFRPIEEEFLEMHSASSNNGGVNVPIVNFTGEDGVVMSLELKINNHKVMPINASEMKIDVNFESNDDNKKIVNLPVEEIKNKVVSLNIGVGSKLQNLLKKFKRIKKVQNSIDGNKIGEVITEVKEDIKSEVEKVEKKAIEVINKVDDEKEEIVNKLFKKNKKAKKK